ncbi:MAG: pyruvate kinase [Gammaproteobacteria bacterium]|nr:pyruvate kinase [Gammaproteobacteria bacterium]
MKTHRSAKKTSDLKPLSAHLQWRRTKIIATLGPASEKTATIEKLLRLDVNAFRLNMSHGDHDSHRQLVMRIRRAAKRLDKHVAIIMDLCGPKIRVGKFEEGAITLQDGDKVIVSSRQFTGQAGLISSQYRQLHKDIKPGERILLDDGNLELNVSAIKGRDVHCKVIYGGLLKNHKGMNLPDSQLSTPSFTAKDKDDAKLAIEADVDFIALSFVRNAGDIQTLQRYLKKQHADIPVIAKIEKPEAIENIDEILAASYGIMIARGDLGIELPAESVPLLQQKLIQKAREYDRPVIVATQMLESMISSARPTRAEVGDVANAALGSADAVMLSGETASGKFPVKAVQTMDRILREIENHQWQSNSFGQRIDQSSKGEYPVREAVARAALRLTDDLKLQGIIVPTHSGTTARILAAARPSAPCIGVCSSARVNRTLALHWGVVPVLVDEPATHDWRSLCSVISNKCNLTKSGHTVLLVSGFNDEPSLNEPVMKILEV